MGRSESCCLREVRREGRWRPPRGARPWGSPRRTPFLWQHAVCGSCRPDDEDSRGSPCTCPRLGPFCEIPAIPPVTPLPAQANRGRFLTARGAAPPACVGNVAFAREGRGASSG